MFQNDVNAHTTVQEPVKRGIGKDTSQTLPPESSVHELFRACFNDLLPVPGTTVARDYGFDNMRIYHGDVVWGESPTLASAENILIGLFQCIKRAAQSFELNA